MNGFVLSLHSTPQTPLSDLSTRSQHNQKHGNELRQRGSFRRSSLSPGQGLGGKMPNAQRECGNLPLTSPFLFSCAPGPKQSRDGSGGGSQQERKQRGNFLLYSIRPQFQEDRTNSHCFVLFCFLSLSVLFHLSQDMSLISKVHNRACRCRVIRASSFWPGNQKGWGQKMEKYQEDCKEQ